ncbi:MFS transporter [Campylobacter jejuni]|nr:MFS transporter [Campylobacter jejuni]
MEVIPTFAAGSCVELRDFMSYVVGASLGTKAIGWAVDYYGSWNADLIMLLSACILYILCSTLCHFSAKKKYQ